MTSLTSSQVSTVITDPGSVDAAIESRFSARAFLPRPVEREVLADLLRVASRAPERDQHPALAGLCAAGCAQGRTGQDHLRGP